MNKAKSKKAMLISLVAVIVLVVLDQLTKLLAVLNLKNNEPFALIKNVFELQYLENQSAAFGVDVVSIFQEIFKLKYFINHPDAFLTVKMVFFAIFTSIVIVILILLYRKVPTTPRFKWINIIFILFIAGAIGNLIDRVINNFVVDFFYFKLIDFPIFNVADIYVTVAAILFIVLGLFYYKEDDIEKIFPNKSKDKNTKCD